MTRLALRPTLPSRLGAVFVVVLAPGCWVSKLVDEPADARDCATRSAYYLDTDADGYGTDLDVVLACAAPEGYAAVGGDCDDADAARALDCSPADTGVDTGDTSGADTGRDTGADTGDTAGTGR